VLLFHSREDHIVEPVNSEIILSRISSSDVREVLLENSYHVATLDNDAELIFSGSLAFVWRVAAPVPGR
jgi:carboxylesterase